MSWATAIGIIGAVVVVIMAYISGVALYRSGKDAKKGELNADVLESVARKDREREDWKRMRAAGRLGADDKRLQPYILGDGVLPGGSTDLPDANTTGSPEKVPGKTTGGD